MNYKQLKFLIPLFFIGFLVLANTNREEWGFYGHKRINRMAVFTLPPEMIVFYKKNIEYITEHAVDPDKRRYATKYEGWRHYIDIDHWGEYPFDEVPRDWTSALMRYTNVYVVDAKNDTTLLIGNPVMETLDGVYHLKSEKLTKQTKEEYYPLSKKKYQQFFEDLILKIYYEEEWNIECAEIKDLFKDLNIDCQSVFAVDKFTEYGVLPYNLVAMQKRLTDAFVKGDPNTILRLSADMGHYVGDAHVPLHTTENYNGEMTDQVGIHAFWESRLPELFADKQYDFFVGKAEYIRDPKTYFWDIVLTSHSYLDSLLAIEKDLSIKYPQDKQFCYEERLERVIRTQCTAYAAEFHRRLDGQVEARMTAAVHAIGSVWYTAWIDAGQPDISSFQDIVASEKEKKRMEEEEKLFNSGAIKGRNHGQ